MLQVIIINETAILRLNSPRSGRRVVKGINIVPIPGYATSTIFFIYNEILERLGAIGTARKTHRHINYYYYLRTRAKTICCIIYIHDICTGRVEVTLFIIILDLVTVVNTTIKTGVYRIFNSLYV